MLRSLVGSEMCIRDSFDDNVSELAREQQIASQAGIKLDKDLDLTDEAMQLSLLESEEPQPTRKRTNGKRKRS